MIDDVHSRSQLQSLSWSEFTSLCAAPTLWNVCIVSFCHYMHKFPFENNLTCNYEFKDRNEADINFDI